MRLEQHQSTARYLQLVERRETEARDAGTPWLDQIESYRLRPDTPANRKRLGFVVVTACQFLASAAFVGMIWCALT